MALVALGIHAHTHTLKSPALTRGPRRTIAHRPAAQRAVAVAERRRLHTRMMMYRILRYVAGPAVAYRLTLARRIGA
jgi:hypothetical protein